MRALLAGLTGCVLLTAHAGEPLDVRVGLDLRAVGSDATASFLDDGLGRLRFDENHDGLRLGQAYAQIKYRLTETLSVRGDALAYGDGHGAAVDITQLYFQYRPFPQSAVRWSTRVGAFYPEFSMEHRGPAWTPVYTLSASAINTWYGEELRALGAETEARWLGASVGYQGDVALIAGVYGWNDPIGILVAPRGWALHDRQTGLFGYLPPFPGQPQVIHEFREIDGRPGYYAGVDWRHGDRLEVRAFRYDNRADPGAVESNVYAWLTEFDAVGVRFEADVHWTFIAQMLRGETYIGPQAAWGKVWDMDAWFALASYQLGPWRWSARYDDFSTTQTKGGGRPLMDDDGHAYTVSADWSFSEHWSAAAEWMDVVSSLPYRNRIGLASRQDERQLQIAFRYQGHW